MLMLLVGAAAIASSWQAAAVLATGGISMPACIVAICACAQQGINAPVSASPLSSRATINTSWISLRTVFS
jgi:hypothetical protein